MTTGFMNKGHFSSTHMQKEYKDKQQGDMTSSSRLHVPVIHHETLSVIHNKEKQRSN